MNSHDSNVSTEENVGFEWSAQFTKSASEFALKRNDIGGKRDRNTSAVSWNTRMTDKLDGYSYKEKENVM
ncbi:unnamed protein product [Angiostrongylus costaricensis]|uniref:Ovule protein n=1 Tax=Angiostrongylus costaricensis TaxID=334426 RepID=A0A0R3PMA3_ANGCS|nr:unnamed protein product [Angiostrongylus costaricensis]